MSQDQSASISGKSAQYDKSTKSSNNLSRSEVDEFNQSLKKEKEKHAEDQQFEINQSINNVINEVLANNEVFATSSQSNTINNPTLVDNQIKQDILQRSKAKPKNTKTGSASVNSKAEAARGGPFFEGS